MGIIASVLARPRVTAFVVVGVVVYAWFQVAPHLGRIGLWPAIVLVAVAIIPGTLALVLIALPLWDRRWLWVAVIVLALLALVFTIADFGLAANFAKLWAAVFAGWAFLRLFERLSWVVLVAFVIPLVDIISVWKGPTHTITQHHFGVYTAVAIAFLVPGGGAAYLGTAGHPVLRTLPGRRRALEPSRRVDVVCNDLHVRIDGDHRNGRRRRRVARAAVPLVRLPRGERGLALARYAPVGGFVGVVTGFFLGLRPGAVLNAVSPIEKGERNDAITARTTAVETANQPAAES